MRRSAWFVIAMAVVSGSAYLLACVGEDPELESPEPAGDAAADDTSSSAVDAQADTSAAADAQADGGAADACGAAKDQSPCGCGGGKSCCLWEDGGTACFPTGNAPSECLNAPNRLIACVGRSSCAADQSCCVVGNVLGGTCPTRLERWDTACNPDGPDPCAGKGVLCTSDSDCALADAGVCVPAVMDGLGRPMGICAP